MSKIGKRGGEKRAYHPAKHELAKRAAEVRWTAQRLIASGNHSMIQRDGEHYIFPWPANTMTRDQYDLLNDADKTKHAHKLVRVAMMQSGFTPPKDCQTCGKIIGYARIVGHHDDYNQPMRVRFICFRCHTAIHHSSVAA